MTDHGGGHSEYVITHDLGTRLQVLNSVGLEVPPADSPLVMEGQRQLCKDLGKLVGDESLVSINMLELAEKIIREARERWPDALFVSACPEINPEGCVQLEVSRLYGLRGIFEGVGPRPGYPSLLEQVQQISASLSGRDVVVLDDGVFTGATAEHIQDRMKAKGITPVAFVAGFAFERAGLCLAQIERSGTEVVLVNDYRPNAWHPDRDFIPFIPGCGRVVGFTMDGKYRTNRFPLYTYNGASYSFPYLAQFSDSIQLWTSWSGLPEDGAEQIGRTSMSLSIKIFEEIDRLNGREVTIGEVIGTSIKTCIPLKVGESDFPPIDKGIVQYLNELA